MPIDRKEREGDFYDAQDNISAAFKLRDIADYDWRVVYATRALENKRLEQLDIATKTGATVLACRNGLWNSELEKQDIEIFLWGTTAELAAAQAQFKLQPLIDRQLDCPEIYWG